jgi:phytoene synthase
VERDLTVLAYATFDDLYAYCFEVAASVGLLCLPVFGRSDPLARRHAVDLGVGMQLTNILRDVAEDGSRGRVYIPRADLARFGISEPDLPRESAGTDGGGDRAPGRPKAREPSGLDALVRFEAARARRFLTSGRRLLPLLEARERFCPAALASIYGALLERIEARGAEALETRVSLPARRKLWLAATSYARARDRSPAGVGDGGAPKQKRRDSHLGESRFDHPRA